MDKALSKIVVSIFDKVSNITFCHFDDPLKERSSTLMWMAVNGIYMGGVIIDF